VLEHARVIRCYRCLRSKALCPCAELPKIANRTEVVILQHEREYRHPLGTARLAHLALANSRLERAGTRAPTKLELPPDAVLLYPSKHATHVDPKSPPGALVALDGTWPQAASLYRANPWLAEMKHVRIDREQPSGYRIRKEPRAECLSTVEAIVEALRTLEPDNAGQLQELVNAFDAMIDRQIEGGRVKNPRRRKRQRNGTNAVPKEFQTRWNDLVVVYAEHFAHDGAPRLLYFTAHKPATGETFARLVNDEHAGDHLARIGLDAHELERAIAPATLAEEWRAFANHDAVTAGWTDAALDLLPARTEHQLHMKPAFTNLHRGPTSHLDVAAARLHLKTPDLPVRGRAKQRLGAAVAIATYLREHVR
jgi:DTW domain-containing protein